MPYWPDALGLRLLQWPASALQVPCKNRAVYVTPDVSLAVRQLATLRPPAHLLSLDMSRYDTRPRRYKVADDRLYVHVSAMVMEKVLTGGAPPDVELDHLIVPTYSSKQDGEQVVSLKVGPRKRFASHISSFVHVENDTSLMFFSFPHKRRIACGKNCPSSSFLAIFTASGS